jgi:AhpD family alkylhydroperoxidase
LYISVRDFSRPRSIGLTEYETTLNDIENTLGFVPGFMKAVPRDALPLEWPIFKKYELEQTEIPAKYRELMLLAVAASIKCPYCEQFHRGSAKMQGASEKELEEAGFLASVTTRWSAIIHAQTYDMQVFKDELQRIGEHLQQKAAQRVVQ